MAVNKAGDSATKLSVLLEWFEDNKVTFNQEAIDIVPYKKASKSKSKSNIVSEDGYGVIARRDLRDGEPLVVIPKSAVLSAATSALASLLFEEQIGDTLALHMAIMYEMSQGRQSPWYGYLQSLPECADVPLLWDAGSRKWLQGTDALRMVERDEAGLKIDFGRLQEVVARNPLIFISQNGIAWDDYKCFLRVASLASSRAFLVDVHRGSSMVPFADIFNHKTNSENVHIESEEMVCPLCGEAFGCEHTAGMESDAENEDEDGDDSDVDDDASMASEHSHGDADSNEGSGWEDDSDHGEEEEEDSDEEPGEELPLLLDENNNPIADDAHPSQSQANSQSEGGEDEDEDGDEDEDEMIDTLDIVVFKPCKAKHEVFNTYGKHSSAALLHRYGFCDTRNLFDSVSLDTEQVLNALAKQVSEKRASEVGQLIDLYADVLEPCHRAKGIEEEEDADEEEDSGEESESDHPTSGHGENDDSDDESEEDESAGDTMVTLSIDAPGHPDLNLAALLVLGLTEEDTFSQVAGSQSVFMHYFPRMRSYWTAFQDRIDAGASIQTAYREASKTTDLSIKKATLAAVCRVVVQLAEKRLADVSDDERVLGQCPAGNADDNIALRWMSAKQLRENERSVLKRCVKLYQNIVTTFSS
ncbi:hypothetical protein H4217_008310 [Coemansia sp. RSA 1939]|nr:hypothetical protein H4217_008310 [Coemansia sp. RSA 1939]KAJ2681524.1 hypothetical protein GGH99_005163 [Coemansia sp. RSA 1285]